MKKESSKLIRKIFLYILPVQIVSGVVLYLHSLADSILVGRFLGENELAIIGLTVPIGLTITFLGCVISNGAQILCGNAMGRGESKSVHATFSNAVVLSAVVGLLASAVCFAFSKYIPLWLGVTDAEMQVKFSDYLRGMCVGFPFTIFFQSLLSFLEFDSARQFAFLSTLAMILTKIVLDLLSIFALHNGMLGIGFATSLSYFVAVFIGFLFFLFKCKSFRFNKKSLAVSACRKLIVKGFPGGLQTLGAIIYSSVLNALAMHYGGAAGVSILTVALNVSELLLGIITSSFTAASVIISVFAGSRDFISMKETSAVSIVASWVLTAISYVVLIFVSKPLAVLFGLHAEAVPIAAHAMRCMVFAGFICWGKLLNLAVYKSMGMVKQAGICCLVSLIIIPVLSSVCLCALFGLEGFWYSYIAENVCSDLVFLVYCSVRKKRIPCKMTEWVYLPHESDLASSQRLDVTMKSSEDVVAVSEKIIAFCKQNGIDGRRGFFSGLCIEELADNIFQHNRTKAGHVSAQLSAIAENGELSITLCDNGRPFNPSEYIKMMEGTDVVDNIGMKLVAKTAESIQYTAPFGLNMLAIRV